MGLFDASQIVNLVGQLGGDHQQASQLLGSALGQGGRVDTQQHGELLQQLGINPQQLHEGGYQEHLAGQNHPDFQGYDQGEGGYEQDQGAYQQEQGGYGQGEGEYEQDQRF